MQPAPQEQPKDPAEVEREPVWIDFQNNEFVVSATPFQNTRAEPVLGEKKKARRSSLGGEMERSSSKSSLAPLQSGDSKTNHSSSRLKNKSLSVSEMKKLYAKQMHGHQEVTVEIFSGLAPEVEAQMNLRSERK